MVGGGPYLRSDRVSLQSLARAVGVHRSTVADRLARWSRIGFMGEWTIDVDPAALGLVGAHVHFDSKAEPRERALVLAALVEGVEGVLAFDQGYVGVIFMADSPGALTRTETLLARILERPPATRIVDTAVDYPDSLPVRLSPIDARLLTILLDDSRQTPAAVAKKADVTVGPWSGDSRGSGRAESTTSDRTFASAAFPGLASGFSISSIRRGNGSPRCANSSGPYRITSADRSKPRHEVSS